MPDSLFALADLLKINDISLAPIDVTDLLNAAPLISRLPYVPATHGTVHKYTKESTAPTVGFRAANAGRAFSKSGDTEVTATLKILDWSYAVDKAIADAYVLGGASAFVGREGRRHLRAALFAYEKQILNGTVDGDAAGFDGFADVIDLANAMCVDAGGTTASTGSSVYMIRAAESDVIGVLGNNGVFDMAESVVQNYVASGVNLPVYYTAGTGYCGLQVGSAHSIGRIANLTQDSGKGLTDDLLYELQSLFPTDRQPTHIVMNRRSREQLRASRTATNATGVPAPLPDQWEGIPIIPTDAILNTETILTGS